MTARLKKLELQNEKSRRNEAEYRRNATDWKNKYNQCWKEYEYFKRKSAALCAQTYPVRVVYGFTRYSNICVRTRYYVLHSNRILVYQCDIINLVQFHFS